jgi:hypothetical protein
VSEQLIEEMVRTIVDEVRPRRIYLFGSYARGSQSADCCNTSGKSPRRAERQLVERRL